MSIIYLSSITYYLLCNIYYLEWGHHLHVGVGEDHALCRQVIQVGSVHGRGAELILPSQGLDVGSTRKAVLGIQN